MTDQQDSGSVVAEQNANSELAQQNDKPNSEGTSQADGSSELAKRFDETAKELRQRVEKAEKMAQSSKDKQFANQTKEINQLKESVVALSDMLREGVPSQPVSRGNAEQDGTTQSVKDIFAQSFDLDPNAVENSPQYIDFIKSGGMELQGASRIASASKFAIARVKSPQQNNISAAAVPQGPGNGVVESSEKDAIDNYTKEMNGARGNPTQLKAIKAKYRGQGVPVDNVGFSF